MVLTSCKSKKGVSENSSFDVLSTKKIVNNHYNNSFSKNTISAKINIDYEDDKTGVGATIRMRMEKDKVIWMSATKLGIPIAKVMITPTNVSYYEKIEKRYFDGDFSLLSKWFGAELNFEMIQNLLLGQAIQNLKKDRYIAELNGDLYQLSLEHNKELWSILFFLNPDNFKMSKQEIRNPEKQQLLSVSYQNYSKINGEIFPENINVRVIDKNKITTIKMEYRSVEFNEELTFPFSFPDGYKEIKIK